jgi:hypothetical protein
MRVAILILSGLLISGCSLSRPSITKLEHFIPSSNFKNHKIENLANLVLIDPPTFYWGPLRGDFKNIEFLNNLYPSSKVKLYKADYVTFNLCPGAYNIQAQFYMGGQKTGDADKWGSIKLEKGITRYFIVWGGLIEISKAEAHWWLDKLNAELDEMSHLGKNDISGYLNIDNRCI